MSDRKRVLVTGAAGHLGSHLVADLAREGYEVTGLDMAEWPGAEAPPVRFVRAELSDGGTLARSLEGAQLVVHCASIHPWKQYSDDQYLDANIKATWHLYKAAAAAGVGQLVLTSSIAAMGYRVPHDRWPVSPDYQGVPEDLYSFTKHAQETIARQFADQGTVRTIALRPPAFMPRGELETGFGLLGAFALVQDIASAHLAAVRVLSGRRSPPHPLRPFEPLFCTLSLPYTAGDVEGQAGGRVTLELAQRYWPQAAAWLAARGFAGAWLPAVYDISRTRQLLGWEPRFDFDWWFSEHGRP
jgi:nucleoside-diphosphate-sugar epimerase